MGAHPNWPLGVWRAKKTVGRHQFQGRFKGGVWHISRQDHGKALFQAQGFRKPLHFFVIRADHG